MIDKLKETYEPENILIVYKSHDSYDNYIEIHDVKAGKIMEGRPLQKKTLFDLMEECSGNSETKLPFRDLVPANIIHYNCNGHSPILVWFEPAVQRYLKFEESDNNLPSGKYNLPPVVFCYRDEELFVYAIAKEQRDKLSLDDSLTHLPLPNIYSDSRVCMGSVDMEFKQELEYVDEIMELCSSKFWKSLFTEFHAPEAVKGVNVYDFWKKHVNSEKPFPVQILKNTKRKLKDLWKE